MTADEATARRADLIAQLERAGALHDNAVRDAMLAVPRHRFLPNEPLERAYADDAIATKIADGVSISSASQPAIVAVMLEQLALAPGMRVLEIGAGTGYNAALLRTLVGPAGHVTTIDIDADITDAARAHLASVGITDIDIITGDGAAGYPPNAPYDRVILTVSAGDIAPAWVDQLAPDGLLLLPLSIGAAQLAIAFEKGDRILRSRSLQACSFMPLRGSMGGENGAGRFVAPAPALHLMLPWERARDADRIAALLQTPPRTRHIPAIGRDCPYALALAGHAPCFLGSEDARYGFTGHGFGLFDPAGTSGCIILLDRPHGYAERQDARVYGDDRAADTVERALAAWQAAGAPRASDYSVTAIPHGPVVDASPGALFVDLPRWRLEFRA